MDLSYNQHTFDMLQLGDPVVLPTGQTGILRYVGKVEGKRGEFAGVELTGKYSLQGRHNGTFNGVQYFHTSAPTAGLFIVASKLSSAGASPDATAASTPRRRSMYNSPQRPLGAPPATPQSANRRVSARFSMGSRQLPSSTGGAGGSTTASRLRPLSPVKAASGLHGDLHHPQPLKVASASAILSKHLPPASPSMGSTASFGSAGSAEYADSATVQSLQSQIKTLTQELHSRDLDIQGLNEQIHERDRLLSETSQQKDMLQQLQGCIAEYEVLTSNSSTIASPNPEYHDLMLALKDKDAKIAQMKSEFEAKRQEFRSAIESYAVDLQEHCDSYEMRIKELEALLAEKAATGNSPHGQAPTADADVAALHKEIESLKQELQTAHGREAEASTQLTMLADMQNRSLQKDDMISDLKFELAELRAGGVSGQPPAAEAEIESLKENLSDLMETAEKLKEINDEIRAENENIKAANSKLLEENSQFKSEHAKLTSEVELLKETNAKASHNGLENDLGTLTLGAKDDGESARVSSLQKENENLERILEKKELEIADLDAKVNALARQLEPSRNTTPATTPSPQSNSKKMSRDLDDHADESFHDPAAGRALWCGLCEREGHNSLDCPYEEEF